MHDNGRAQMLQLLENFGQEKENSGFQTRNPVMNCVERVNGRCVMRSLTKPGRDSIPYQNNCLIERA